MKLGTKIAIAAASAVLLTTVGSEIAVYFVAKGNRINEIRDVMATTLTQAEKVRSQFENIHKNKGIDMPTLAQRAKTDAGTRPLREVYTQTALYDTIPIAASWQTVQDMATKKGFGFFTLAAPDSTPRNPRNKAGEQFNAVFEGIKAGKNEYFHYDRSKQQLVLAHAVRLSESCLICHGSPENSPTKDGLDYTGFAMENMKTGDLRGAFVLVAPMTNDPVLKATMSKISIVGLFILAASAVGFYLLNQRLIMGPLTEAIDQISTAGEQTGQASNEILGASHGLAEAASEQAASLQETSASLEEMASMTKRNAESAIGAKELANQTRTVAEAGEIRTHQMNESIQAINISSQEMRSAMDAVKESNDQVSKIIKTIDEIAFQTNILALNAAVEAARAGAAGLGFAVVADEVRRLAQKSALAAKETTEKIEAAIQRSDAGVRMSEKVAENLIIVVNQAKEVEKVLQAVVEKVRKVDDLMGEISTASKEQTQGIDQINVTVGEMDRVTQSNAAMAEETSSASEELNAQSKCMHEAVLRLVAMLEGKGGESQSVPNATRSAASMSAVPRADEHQVKSMAFAQKQRAASPSTPSAPSKGKTSKSDDNMFNEGDFKDF
jgi:methyl-accepting chemotaxis protein